MAYNMIIGCSIDAGAVTTLLLIMFTDDRGVCIIDFPVIPDPITLIHLRCHYLFIRSNSQRIMPYFVPIFFFSEKPGEFYAYVVDP